MARQSLTIKLHLSELLYDVQNKTYIVGRNRAYGSSNPEQVASMQANDDDENKNQLLRSIQNACGVLSTKLSEFCQVAGASSPSTVDNQLISSTDDYVITLSMPSNYNMTASENVVSAAHQYVVNMAIAEWFAMTNREDASNYITTAAACLNEISAALSKRVCPTRQTV